MEEEQPPTMNEYETGQYSHSNINKEGGSTQLTATYEQPPVAQ